MMISDGTTPVPKVDAALRRLPIGIPVLFLTCALVSLGLGTHLLDYLRYGQGILGRESNQPRDLPIQVFLLTRRGDLSVYRDP